MFQSNTHIKKDNQIVKYLKKEVEKNKIKIGMFRNLKV